MPKKWTTPDPCDTEYAEEGTGNCEQIEAAEGAELHIYGDGSGGPQASDARYRRCGWAWTVLDPAGHVAASKRGPLAGPRQSSNRAEIQAFISAVRSSRGPMTYWTDSEVLCRGWRRRRHLHRRNADSNADLWQQVGKAVADRGPGDIQIHWIESHMSWRLAQAKGVPLHAWRGNRAADELAGQAAEAHSLPDSRLSLYEWMRATAALVHRRLTRAALDGFAMDPPMTATEKQLKRQMRQAAKAARTEKSDWLKSSPHALKATSSRWECKLCGQAVSKQATNPVLKSWLKHCRKPTSGPTRSVLLSEHRSHHTHPMYLTRGGLWFCGALAAQEPPHAAVA